MTQFDITLTPIEGHEGQRYMMYSSVMHCEFPVNSQDIPKRMGDLFNEFMDLLDVEIKGTKKYRVYIGESREGSHSYRDFTDHDHAHAFMWAMAKCNHPQNAFLFQGTDGWHSNRGLKNQPVPDWMQDRVNQYILEDNQATLQEAL